MIYYCSEFAPFTSVQQHHILELEQASKGQKICLLFLNTTFTSAQTEYYFHEILAELGQRYTYQQVSQQEVATMDTAIYFDGLLRDRFSEMDSACSFLHVPQVYGYESIPFIQSHVFDDVPERIAAFIVQEQLYGIDQDMKRVYSAMRYGRFQHTMRVRYLIKTLAEKHHLDVEKAQFTALFHDYAKEMPVVQLTRMMRENFPAYFDAPEPTWHGFVGAKLVKDTYAPRVFDANMYEAIAFHAVGKANYGRLGLALFIADFCDYRRPFSVVTEEVWHLGQESLYRGALAKIVAMQAYFANNNKQLYRTTQAMQSWLKETLEVAD